MVTLVVRASSPPRRRRCSARVVVSLSALVKNKSFGNSTKLFGYIGFLSGDPQPYNARCGRAPSLEIVGVSGAYTWRFAAGARDTGACTRGAAAIRTTLDHLSWLELTDLLLSTFASARSTPEHGAQVRQHRVPRRGTSRARPGRRTATAPAAPTVVASQPPRTLLTRAAHLTSALSRRKRPCGARAGCPRAPPRPRLCATHAASCARPASPASPRTRREVLVVFVRFFKRSASSRLRFPVFETRAFPSRLQRRVSAPRAALRRRDGPPSPSARSRAHARSRHRATRRSVPAQVQARLVLLVVLDRLPQARGGRGSPVFARRRARRQALGRVRPVRPLVAPVLRARQRPRVPGEGTRGGVRRGEPLPWRGGRPNEGR